MLPEPSSQDSSLFRQLNLDNGIGYLLIFCGLAATLAASLEIYMLFMAPQQLVTFRQLFPEQLTISWENGQLALPAEVLAYLLSLILLSMAGGIAGRLINAGIGWVRRR